MFLKIRGISTYPLTNKMKITFVVPALNLTGGVRVVSIYAKLLAERGHTVTVVSPGKKVPTLKEKIKAKFSRGGILIPDHPQCPFFDDGVAELIILDKFRPITENDVPDADIVIATFWYTAEWVAEFSEAKGKKVYFIQHYEMHPWLPVNRVKATLKLPFKKIAVSQWIANMLLRELQCDDTVVIGNGVDSQQFYADPRQKLKIPTVGVMYADHLSFKGCDMSIASVVKARELIPELKLISFGAKAPVLSLPLPENSEFFLQPKQEDIHSIYSRCDIWLFGSRSEGFGLPLLEAMACRTPVIATKTGAAPELLKNGAGILVDVDDVDAMSSAIVKICRMNNQEWLDLSNEAYEISKIQSWEKKVEEFERELQRLT